MKQNLIDGAVYILFNILGIILALYLINLYSPCLPDTEDRFYMGRGSRGQCLYEDKRTGEVYDMTIFERMFE